MSDFVLHTGDKVIFQPMFGKAIVTSMPAVMIGSGKCKISGKKVCVLGDERKVVVPGCTYISGQCVIPGSGTLFIDKLDASQIARNAKSRKKALLLKGAQFEAKFMVLVPAQQPSVPTPMPDTTLFYKGKGMFLTTNTKVKAS